MLPETQYARVGDIRIAYQVLGVGFDDRGTHELKGVPGEWHLYAVSSDDRP
jgi:hypothetical protein